jgi:hypothetical protein
MVTGCLSNLPPPPGCNADGNRVLSDDIETLSREALRFCAVEIILSERRAVKLRAAWLLVNVIEITSCACHDFFSFLLLGAAEPRNHS